MLEKIEQIMQAIKIHAEREKAARKSLSGVQWDEAIDRLIEIVVLHQPDEKGYCDGCEIDEMGNFAPGWPCPTFEIAMGIASDD